jgi:hypothetical protein
MILNFRGHLGIREPAWTKTIMNRRKTILKEKFE